MRVARLLLVLTAVAASAATLAAPDAAAAQNDAPTHLEIVLRAGLTGYGTGSDDGCQSLAGALLGTSVRSSGSWFVGAGADVVLTGGFACTDELAIHRLEDGRYYIEDGRLLMNSPRAVLEAGRRVSLGTANDLEVAASGGAALNAAYGSSVAPWAGASVAFSSRRLGLRFEHGWHWIRIERTLEGESQPFDTVRYAAPATLLMVTFRLR
jgi:hypothetical protein